MARMTEEQMRNMAKLAFRYDAKENTLFGFSRKQEPNCYGKLIKYVMYQRGFSFRTFSEQMNITPQALNHRLNRQKGKNLKIEDVEKYCKLLRFDKDDFITVSEYIRELENERNGTI